MDTQMRQSLQGLQQQITALQQAYQHHDHNGTNSVAVKPQNLAGQNVSTGAYVPLQVLTTTTYPTGNVPPATDGATLLVNNAGTYRLYAHVNGAWHYATLT